LSTIALTIKTDINLKVLHLSSERSWRGGEQQIAYLIDELTGAGIESIVACRTGSAFEAYCIKNSITYKSLPFRNSLDVYSAWQIRLLCRRWQPDILHIHSSKSHSIAWLASLLGNNIPLVLSRRVAFSIRQSSLNIKKYNHPQLRKVICITEAVKKKVLPLLADPSQALVIHSGIDLSHYPPQPVTNYLKERYQLPANSFLIGTIAAFTKEKDYSTFLLTAEKVIKNAGKQEQEIYFIAMGEGPERSAMEALAEKLQISPRVIFTGFIPEAKAHLQELDLFLFTSTNEGLGTSLLDAFANKVPVVATDAGGIPEIVRHEETGLLAPVGDSSLLAHHIQRLWQDTQFRNQLTQTAFRFVQSFDKNITAQKTLMVYRNILQKSRQ
jgi:glycosyltransferase involved in cell wall biosynthesis